MIAAIPCIVLISTGIAIGYFLTDPIVYTTEVLVIESDTIEKGWAYSILVFWLWWSWKLMIHDIIFAASSSIEDN